MVVWGVFPYSIYLYLLYSIPSFLGLFCLWRSPDHGMVSVVVVVVVVLVGATFVLSDLC